VIKVVRDFTRLVLKYAKELVDAPTCTIKEGVAKGEAEEIKKTLEELGAVVELKLAQHIPSRPGSARDLQAPLLR
jgi:large subunit ribosomal protein L7/L12